MKKILKIVSWAIVMYNVKYYKTITLPKEGRT